MAKSKAGDYITIVLAILLCVVGIVFLDKIFSMEVNGLNQEIFSAVLASIFTVAAMSIVIKLQSKQEKEKEFACHLFERKMTIYQELLQILFKADDDNILSDDEIQEIENKIGEISMVASAKLISRFAQFMIQLKIYGCLYPRSMDTAQREHYIALLKNGSLICRSREKQPLQIDNFDNIFITLDDLLQGIREDLNVVEGNIKADVSGFVSIAIDKYGMKRTPTIID